MILLLLILIIQYVSGSDDTLSNETLAEIRKLNEMEYSQESIVTDQEAEFRFIISNTTYARDELGIDSYYYSITFIDEERYEERMPIQNLPTNETTYHGILKMKGLEEEENYLICVFFLKNNQTDLIVSSRFCDVVSVSGNCKLEPAEKTFEGSHIFVILGFAVFLLTATVLFTCIRDYVYRPRTIEALLKTLPEHHAINLENLAPTADGRRRRRTQQELDNRLREDSVLTVNYDPDADHEYAIYHGHDNMSLDTLPE